MSDSKKLLNIEGMTCTNCAAGVKRVIEKNGGKDVHVDFSSGEAIFSDSENKLNEIKSAIDNAGYKVVKKQDEAKYSRIEKLFFFCALFTLPLILHMFFPGSALLNNIYFQISMSSIVLLIGGSHFLKSAFSSLKTGVPNMDVLISIGAFSAYGYSLYGSLTNIGTTSAHDYLFFETAATIVTLVLLGNVFEDRSVRQTTSAIRDLKSLQPDKVKRIDNDHIHEVPTKEIKKNDLIQINEGDRIPLDGIIIEGSSEIDESLITGESLPVHKEKDAQVYSGSLVVNGPIKVKVSKVLGESTVDGIINLVKNAQTKKPAIQKIGDRVSGVFVPVVLGIALLTILLSYFVFNISFEDSMMHGIAVLVISCPCAMGLAAPTAVMVGIGRAAKMGILIKGGDTLEKLAKVETIVFDKTGTLTTGEFDIDRINVYKEREEKVKMLILGLEQHSSHPIAKSLVKILAKEVGPIHFSNVKEIKGAGMTGTDPDGFNYHLTSSKYASTLSTRDFSSDLVLFQNGSVIGELWIKDQLKEGIKETVAQIKNLGIKVLIMSGDKETKVAQTASTMHFDGFFAQQTPEQKLTLIKELNQKEKTIMIGDGINDAPALAASFTGISFGNATDVAVTASDVVLLNKDVNALYEALLIGRKTYRTIKQNFFWAFFYNIVAIPVAAIGYLVPMMAALTMAFSDVIVIGNSILLKFKKLK